jgi:hypothetical protein
VKNRIVSLILLIFILYKKEIVAGSQSPSSVTPQPRPAKINRRNEHGETIVHIAARKGDLKQLKKVLKAGANVNEADNAGRRVSNAFYLVFISNFSV